MRTEKPVAMRLSAALLAVLLVVGAVGHGVTAAGPSPGPTAPDATTALDAATVPDATATSDATTALDATAAAATADASST